MFRVFIERYHPASSSPVQDEALSRFVEQERPVTDIFSSYECGLEELLERLGKDHPRHAEALTLQSRLLENIAQTRRYGDTEIHRAERAQVVDALNNLALQAIHSSFNELGDSTVVHANSRLKVDLGNTAAGLLNLCNYLQDSRDFPSKETVDALFDVLSEAAQIIRVTQDQQKPDASYLTLDDVAATLHTQEMIKRAERQLGNCRTQARFLRQMDGRAAIDLAITDTDPIEKLVIFLEELAASLNEIARRLK